MNASRVSPENLRVVARGAVERVAPGLLADRARRYAREVRRRHGVLDLTERYVDCCGCTVQAGPVRGLCYPREAVGGLDAPLAMLAGSYEQEIHHVLERELERGPMRFIDIGAGVGHYAVGVARRLPHAEVVGFELSRQARRACRRLAEFNDVGSRLALEGKADADTITAGSTDGALILSDCEGAEEQIFSEAVARRLTAATIIIEAHETVLPGVTDVLIGRFEATHAALVIEQQPRDPRRYPALRHLSATEQELALDELRPPSDRFLVLRPLGR